MAFCFDETKFKINNYAYSLGNDIKKLKQQGKTVIGLHLARSKMEGYKDFLQKIVDVLILYKNIFIVILPHDYREYENKYSDFEMANLIEQNLKKNNIDCLNAYDLGSEANVKYITKYLDLLITSRMHVAIAALSRNVPVISFVYQNKFEGLYAMYDFKRNLMFDGNSFEEGSLKEAIDYVLAQDFSQMMLGANKKIKKLSEKNFEFENINHKNIKEYKISVLIVTYNQEQYIAKAIESVLAQNCQHIFEIIVPDDGSTDKALMIVDKYRKKYPDLIKLATSEHVIKSNEKIGKDKVHARIRANYVRGINACSDKADYIAILEGDDYWYPDKMNFLADYFMNLRADEKNIL